MYIVPRKPSITQIHYIFLFYSNFSFKILLEALNKHINSKK